MRPPRRPTRRAFLAAAALAPVAAAAQESPPTAPPAVTVPPPEPAVPESLREIREFDVPLGTEPAFVFRAVARPSGGGAPR